MRRAIRIVIVVLFGLVALLFVVPVVLLRVNGPRRPSIGSIAPTDVVQIELRLDYGPVKTDTEAITTSDAHAIESFLDVLKSAEVASEHKCGSVMVVLIALKSGKRIELRPLPGHDASYYEYRANNNIYRVRRDAFVAAVRKIGLEQIPLDP